MIKLPNMNFPSLIVSKGRKAFKRMGKLFVKPKIVDVYIIDTGVNCEADLLYDRIEEYWTIFPNPDDEIGHGTSVACVVAEWAPHAKLYPYKVIDSAANYSKADTELNLVLALQNIRDNYKHENGNIITMSIDYLTRNSINLLNDFVEDGFIVVMSAKNDGQYVPKSTLKIFWYIGAIAADGSKEWYSNYGPGVAFYAKGTHKTLNHHNEYVEEIGTSFSSPYVAAYAARTLRYKNYAQEKLGNKMRDATSSSYDETIKSWALLSNSLE